MKTSALRRWLVILGLIARDQTTRLTGGYDLKFNKLKVRARSKAFLWKDKMKFSLGLKKQELDI